MRLPRFRFRVSHLRFSIAYCLFLYIGGNALNLSKLAAWFRQGDGVDYLALGSYLLAGLCLFLVIFLLFAHRWTLKPLAIVLAVASGLCAYFIAKYGVAIDSSMIRNTIHTDATEVGQLLSWQMVPYLALLVVLPVSVILFTEVTFEPRRYLLTSAKALGVALALALGCLYANFNAIHRAGNISNKYIVYTLVPINVISATVNVAGKAIKPYFARKKQAIPFSARVQTPGNLVVVLAVGESSRKQNFSLYGYGRRETNPVLKTIPGLHLLDGVASRASTLYALPMILTKKDITLPAVVAKAGIPASCLSNYTLYDNCDPVVETKVSDCGHGGKCYDEDVLPLLEANLRDYQSGYRFVVLHLGGGSHGPAYADRHPPEFQRFEPQCKDADVANRCTLEQLYNSYDNTILYVDHVLGGVIGALERSRAPYVLIYLSDHGESLMEEGRLFHGVPPGMALPAEQAQIPLIVKASVPIEILKRAEYQQPEVFDTVLDLFSIQSDTFDKAGSFIKHAR